VAGFGKGAADVALTADGSETVLRYTAKAQVGGKIAQIGSRLVDSAAEKVSGEFFTAFEKYLLDLRTASQAVPEAVAETAPGEAAVAGVAPPAPVPARPVVPVPVSAPSAAGIPWGWVAIGAAVGALITWLLIK
jgi:hypothetical protein